MTAASLLSATSLCQTAIHAEHPDRIGRGVDLTWSDLRCSHRASKLEGDGASRTHYETLEVAHDASPDEIRQNYRRLILVHHPDKRSNSHQDHLPRQAEALNVAYAVLSDAASRSDYDEALKAKQAEPTPSSNMSAVSHIVSLSDFAAKDEDGIEKYYFPSRCGGDFEVDVQELEEGNGDLLLQCDGCTERIRVVYELA